MATTKGTSPKIAYIYKESSPTPGSGTWHPIIGIASTSANYTWTGTHAFNDHTVTFEEVLVAQGGVNNFLDETARDAALPSPDYGTAAFVKQTNSSVVINQIQYWDGTIWRNYAGYTTVAEATDSFSLALTFAGKTVTLNKSTAITVTVPANSAVAFPIGARIDFIQTGAGQASFAASSGVTINSKGSDGTGNGNKKISARYSGATLIKKATDEWLLVGDLTA